MKQYHIPITEKQIEEADKWGSLANEYNLNYEDFRELVFHVIKIQELLNKQDK